jgi:hypothetical protein
MHNCLLNQLAFYIETKIFRDLSVNIKIQMVICKICSICSSITTTTDFTKHAGTIFGNRGIDINGNKIPCVKY